MSIREIIEEIRKLPPEEQQELLSLLKNLVEAEMLHDEGNVSYMDAEKAKALSAKIFSERAELFRKLAS